MSNPETITAVFCKVQFEGFHRWPEAPLEVSFLRTFHRHVFHVNLVKQVTHDNRDIEFILLKRKVEDFCKGKWGGWERRGTFSCEMIAKDLLEEFGAVSVRVSEDGENGAHVTRSTIVAPEPIKSSKNFMSLFDALIKDIPSSGISVGVRPSGMNLPPDVMKEIDEEAKRIADMIMGPDKKDVVVTPEQKAENDQAIASAKKVLKSKPFFGVEAEGPTRGNPTLFIPGSSSGEHVSLAIAWAKKPGHKFAIYYGAGNDLDLNGTTLRKCLQAIEDPRLVSVEIPGLTKLQERNPLLREAVCEMSRAGSAVVTNTDEKPTKECPNLFVKTFGPHPKTGKAAVIWECRSIDFPNFDGKVYHTELSDHYYSIDRDVPGL